MKAVPDISDAWATRGDEQVVRHPARNCYRKTHAQHVPYQNRLWWIGKVYQDLAQIARKELGKLIMDSRPVMLGLSTAQSQTSDPGDCLLKT